MIRTLGRNKYRRLAEHKMQIPIPGYPSVPLILIR
jgi:hypothetical protein